VWVRQPVPAVVRDSPVNAAARRSTHLATLGLALLAACSSSPPPTSCTPGRSVACVGAGSCQGFQTCAVNGQSYSPCLCGGGGPTAGGSNGGGSTSGGAHASSGGASAAATTGGTGHGAGSSGGHGSSGGGTTGGGSCLFGGGGATEFHACTSAASCSCGQVCVVDPAFSPNAVAVGQAPTATVCETPCQTNADCPNAASYCVGTLGPSGGPTCEVNWCGFGGAGWNGSCALDANTETLAGTACDYSAAGAGDGTWVPQASTSVPAGVFVLCMPNGSATACSPATNDNPAYGSGAGSLALASPQPRQSSLYCPAGTACSVSGDGGSCQPLCNTISIPLAYCPGGNVCVSTRSLAPAGICGACLPLDAGCASWPSCCNQFCNNGVCAACQPTGKSCATVPCCNGYCQDDSAGKPVCICGQSGWACRNDGDCCSGNCSDETQLCG